MCLLWNIVTPQPIDCVVVELKISALIAIIFKKKLWRNIEFTTPATASREGLYLTQVHGRGLVAN